MTEQDVWTLDELIARVAQALGDGYSGAPSGRVRDLPDARTVRWYATRALVDPPLGMRGRQALYGRRHLLQLVALKRRQAQGVALAQIQLELTGLPDTSLAEIADLPGAPAAPGPPSSLPLPAPQFGAQADGSGASAARTRFWAAPPVPRSVPVPAGPSPAPAASPALSTSPAPSADGWLPPLHGIRLASGVVLLLDADVAAAAHPLDDAALRAAAVPLLDLLHRTRTDEGTRR